MSQNALPNATEPCIAIMSRNRRSREPSRSTRNRSGRGKSSIASRDSKASSRRIWVLLSVCTCLALIFWGVGGPVSITNYFASVAVRQRNPEQASSWLELGQRLSTKNAEGQLLRARLARRSGDLPQMQRSLMAAADAGAAQQRIELEQLLAEVQSGHLEGAEARLSQWLTDGHPDTPEIADAYANGLALVSRFAEALHVLEAWANDYPSDPMPVFRAGKIHEFYEDKESAQSAYREGIRRDSDFYPARFSLGRLLLDEKKPEEARGTLEPCLEMANPLAVEVAIAQCLLELGETEQAVARLRQVLAHDNSEIDASYRALLSRPERFIAAAELGQALVNRGDFEDGLRWLDRALQHNPRDLSARYSRAVALRGLGKEEIAQTELEDIEAYREAMQQVNNLRNQINRAPQNVDARIELGTLLAEYESVQNGLFWLKSALTYEPENELAQQRIAKYSQHDPEPIGTLEAFPLQPGDAFDLEESPELPD